MSSLDPGPIPPNALTAGSAVSLRRVAAGLDVLTMPLFRSIASKHDLLAGMTDTPMGEELRLPPFVCGVLAWRSYFRAADSTI